MSSFRIYRYLFLLLSAVFSLQTVYAGNSGVGKLLERSKRLHKSNPQLSYDFLLQAEKLIDKRTGHKLTYDVYNELSIRETERKDFKKAIIANLNLVRSAKKTDQPLLIADAHYALALSYKPLKLFDEVDLNLKKAREICRTLKNRKELALIEYALGNNTVDLAMEKKDPQLLDVAASYYLKTLRYFKLEKDKEQEARVTIALGNLYLRFYSMKRRPIYIRESIAYSEKAFELIDNDSTNSMAAYCIGNIGEAYGLIGDRKKEQYYYERSLPLYKKAGQIGAMNEQLLLLVSSYIASRDFNKAAEYLEEFRLCNKDFTLPGTKKNYYEKLAELYYANGNLSGAYRYRLLFEEANDFHLRKEKEQEIMRLQVLNEIVEKDRQIAFLQENESLHAANLANHSVIRNLLLAGVILALLIIVLLIYRYKEKNKLTGLMLAKNIELQKLSIVASETMNGVVITDKTGRPEWMNEGYKRMFGWDSIDDFLHHLGDNFLSLSSLKQEDLKEYQRIAIEEHRSIKYQSVNSTKSGRRLDIQTNMTPVFDEVGELSYWVLVETDVTEINLAREMAENEQRISENALKIQELFIANVSHEIRTPMNGIMGLSRQMNDIAITAQQKELASAILKTSSGLLHVVNDLLDMSKIRAGKMNFRSEPFELRSCMETIKRTVQVRMEEKGLAYSCSKQDAVPEWVSGDVGRLNQILLNLVGNAVKFTERGEIRLEIHVLDQTVDACVLAFSVKDTGPGIPKDKHQFVFENFAQLEDHRTRSAGGTGLGLGICKTLTEAMGGKLNLESDLGKGSVFTVELPFKLVTKEEIPLQVDASNAEILNGKAILLVEDNKVNQWVASYELSSWGARVSVANHAEEAFDLLRQDQFDIILMDISMPKMDGLQATQHIRKTFPENVRNLPIIAMTASAMTSNFASYLEAGMNDAISKPYEPIQLLALLNKWLNKTEPQLTVDIDEPASVTTDSTIIDLSVLHSRAKGDVNYLIEMFRVFLDNMPLYIRDLSASVRDSDLDELRSDAHRMLGPARLFGLETITKSLERMEKLDSSDPLKLEEWLHQIENDYQFVESFVKEELKDLENLEKQRDA